MSNRKYPPPYRRRHLGRELRRLREAANLSMPDAGRLLGVTHQTISNMELGVHRVRKAELALLLSSYGADEENRRKLEEHRAQSEIRHWWAGYGAAVPDWFRPYLDMEATARAVRVAEPELFPGLLRTESYARAVCQASRHVLPPAAIEQATEAIAQRQLRLYDHEQPLGLCAVVGEAALRRQLGGVDVLAEQLEHVLRVTQLPNVRLRVIPFDVDQPAICGPLALVEFDEFPTAGYAEYPTGGLVLDQLDEVARFALIFDDLLAAALSPAESRTLVESRLEGLRASVG